MSDGSRGAPLASTTEQNRALYPLRRPCLPSLSLHLLPGVPLLLKPFDADELLRAIAQAETRLRD